MRDLQRYCVWLVAATMWAAQDAAARCALQRIEIRPLTHENGPVYVGAAAGLQLRLRNEQQSGEVTAFPEPPLEILDRRGQAQCRLVGGIWARDSVFVSADGRTLLTLEYSGAWQALLLRDVRTCRKVGEIDLSAEPMWKIETDRIVIGDASRARTVRLDDRCRVRGDGGQPQTR
jgi:hypothetical protein